MTGTNGDSLSEIRDILRDIAERQLNLSERQDRFQSQLEATQNLANSNIQALQAMQSQLEVTQNLTNSNARSIQAWEALIEQNKVEAEEERSQLRVELNELKQASRENIQQHFEFMRRFDQVLGEIQQIWQRLAG